MDFSRTSVKSTALAFVVQILLGNIWLVYGMTGTAAPFWLLISIKWCALWILISGLWLGVDVISGGHHIEAGDD